MGCGKTRDLPRFSPPSLSLLSYFLHSSSSRFFPLPSRCRIFSFSSFFFAKLAAIEEREIRIDRKNERRRRKKGRRIEMDLSSLSFYRRSRFVLTLVAPRCRFVNAKFTLSRAILSAFATTVTPYR